MIRDEDSKRVEEIERPFLSLGKETSEVPYRSSEFTREILHSRRNQRVVGDEVVEGRKGKNKDAAPSQVLLSDPRVK